MNQPYFRNKQIRFSSTIMTFNIIVGKAVCLTHEAQILSFFMRVLNVLGYFHFHFSLKTKWREQFSRHPIPFIFSYQTKLCVHLKYS
jgi:hypothetical protein